MKIAIEIVDLPIKNGDFMWLFIVICKRLPVSVKLQSREFWLASRATKIGFWVMLDVDANQNQAIVKFNYDTPYHHQPTIICQVYPHIFDR